MPAKTAKADPPVSIARPNAQNNRHVRAKRLRDIAALVKARKMNAAWHALIAWAEKEEQAVK